MTDDVLRRIDALIQVGLRIARTAPSGRIALARIADAIDPSWIPRPWGDEIAAELEAASARARAPLPAKQVEKLLKQAWGAPPKDELDELDTDPVAVTPTSQVHRGVLDGARVAVKLLRPGLPGSIRQDVALLETLVAPLQAAFPAVNAAAILREFRERVLEELDLEHEATIQRRFHRALKGHPQIVIPAPVTRLSHEHVLVSEWIDGVPLSEVRDADAAAAMLVAFVIGAARSGLIHADPNPDDVLVLADGRLAILDFGAVREVDPQRVALAADALDAFLARDADAFGETLQRLGALPATRGETALTLAHDVLGDLVDPGQSRLDNDALLAARERLFDHMDWAIEVIEAGALPPEDLWPARGVGQLFGTIARVGATGDWVEVSRTALREGWQARL